MKVSFSKFDEMTKSLQKDVDRCVTETQLKVDALNIIVNKEVRVDILVNTNCCEEYNHAMLINYNWNELRTDEHLLSREEYKTLKEAWKLCPRCM